MLVKCFTVTMRASASLKSISNEFGNNIPRSLPFEGGAMGFVTHLFCVDANVNVQDICEKYECKMGSLTTLQIEDNIYNNNYSVSYIENRKGTQFHLNKLVPFGKND
jgi:hypothetical protein